MVLTNINTKPIVYKAKCINFALVIENETNNLKN